MMKLIFENWNKYVNEGEVVPVDFQTKTIRKTLNPHIFDVFLFSANGNIAKVIEMKRDENDSGGGYVVYEQYTNKNGEWQQAPAETLNKSFTNFISRWNPYDKTIEHLTKQKSENKLDDEHIEKIMREAGFEDYLHVPLEVQKSKEYEQAIKKAMTTMPSLYKVLDNKTK